MGRRLLRRAFACLFAAALTCPSVALAEGFYPYNAWGSCGHVPGMFDLTSGVAVDANDNVYVIDYNNGWVQKFTNGGQYVTSWTLPGLSPSPRPYAIAVDGGYVYVADGANNCVLKYTTDGDYVLQWGAYGQGDGEFYQPFGIAIAPDHSVYVSDNENHRIQKFTPQGEFLLKWGPYAGTDAQLEHPRGLEVDDAGNVYVAQHWMVQIYTGDGQYIGRWGGPYENGLVVDITRGPDGNYYLADQFFNRVAQYSPQGVQLRTFSADGSGFGSMAYPTGVAVDSQGNVFVSDYQKCRVVEFAPCPPIVVSNQPEPLALSYGATAVFSVTASNVIGYQWIRDDATLYDTMPRLSGTDTGTLTITGFQESDAGPYWCIMTNVCGEVVLSDTVMLSHATAPSCYGIAAPPPSGMAAWWAMDPGPGNTTPDVLHPTGNKNHASLTGAASLVTGKVGTAVRCEGLGDGLHVPSTLSPRLAAASAGLSIDAWILPRSGSPASDRRMIFHKGLMKKATTSAGGVTSLAPGYAFYLRDGGQLGFQMPDPSSVPVSFEPAMPALSMDEWHHVAVTVDPLVAGGGKFYVDGVPVASFTPPSGILGNLADAYIGQFSPQLGPEITRYAFHGDIDEVEVFVVPIDSAAVRKIWSAGCTGKRRVQVLTNSLVSIREGTASAPVCFSVQNLSAVAHDYQWAIATTAPGAGCASSVPVSFAAASGTVSVPAGARADLSAVASVSPADLAAPFTRCYQVTVTDLADNGVMTASGKITFTGAHISGRAACMPPEIGESAAAPFGEASMSTGVATFTVFNDGPTGVNVPLQVSTRDPETGGASSVLRIASQAPGTPWATSLFVPAFGSAPLPVSVSLDEHEPLLPDELVLSADPDGNAAYDEIASSHVAAGNDTSLVLLGVDPGAERTAQAFALRAAPNPFGGATAFTFTLAQASPVELDVVDVTGRHVRRVSSARLEAGAQRIAWDGRDDRGARLPAGVYLGRIRAGHATAVVRLLRMR